MKFIAIFVKKSKLALIKLNKNKANYNTNSFYETDYHSLRREKFFNSINGNLTTSSKNKNIKNPINNGKENIYHQTLPNVNRTLYGFKANNLENIKDDEKNRSNK